MQSFKRVLVSERVSVTLLCVCALTVITFCALAIVPGIVEKTTIGQIVGGRFVEAYAVPPHAGILRQVQTGSVCWLWLCISTVDWACDNGYYRTQLFYNNQVYDENAQWYQCNSN